jgi:hypothetical protein
MPQLRGDDLAAAVLLESPQLPVVLMTGFAEEPTAVGVGPAAGQSPQGSVRLLAKPFAAADLLARLAEALAAAPQPGGGSPAPSAPTDRRPLRPATAAVTTVPARGQDRRARLRARTAGQREAERGEHPALPTPRTSAGPSPACRRSMFRKAFADGKSKVRAT